MDLQKMLEKLALSAQEALQSAMSLSLIHISACDKAATELGWVAEYDLARMCADAWNWQSQNPNGYNA